MSKNIFSTQTTKRMSGLSHLLFDRSETAYFTKQFNQTLDVVNRLNSLDTHNVEITKSVNGLENVFKPDRLEPKRILTQKQALANAKKTYRGYFLVKAIFTEHDT